MALVVQKYGGSSVADADGIKRVAQRIVVTHKAGHSVVVVVSAMGDTTDELHDLAKQVSPLPPARELDMLLTSGERISMALLAMAIANLGLSARSFTGSQAGVITDDVHGKAKIIDVTPGRISGALTDGAIAWKIFAAWPTTSGTPATVTLASLRSCATPEMIACSMPASCFAPRGTSFTQVPSLLLNDDLTWIGTPYRRAYSTQRNCSTLAPDAAISSISS